jgi:ankyrin repeat protein
MDELGEDLLDAIEDDDIDEVIKILNKGADVNYDDNFPLCLSAELGLYEITELLIDRGANINHQDKSQQYPIYYASLKGHSRIIELLFEKGAILKKERNMDDIYHFSFFSDCIFYDDVQTLKLLVEHGLDLDKHIFWAFDVLINERYDESNKHIRKANSKNILEYILCNYPEEHPDNVYIIRKDMNKYKFIKMLVDRNMIDLPD